MLKAIFKTPSVIGFFLLSESAEIQLCFLVFFQNLIKFNDYSGPLPSSPIPYINLAISFLSTLYLAVFYLSRKFNQIDCFFAFGALLQRHEEAKQRWKASKDP